MAILLDGRVQGRPPVIQSRIGRNGQITLGGRTLQEAQDLALTLKAGALPIPLKIVEERQVGRQPRRATRSGRASSPGIVGTALVVLIMVVYYRLSGVLAVAALALYVLFTLGGLVDAGRDAHPAGPRGLRAVDRHRGGRQRADLRAHPGGAGGTGRRCASPWTRDSSTR